MEKFKVKQFKVKHLKIFINDDKERLMNLNVNVYIGGGGGGACNFWIQTLKELEMLAGLSKDLPH